MVNEYDVAMKGSEYKNLIDLALLQLHTVDETADLLRCSRFQLWKLRKSGLIKFVTVGHRILFKRSDIENYLNRAEVANG